MSKAARVAENLVLRACMDLLAAERIWFERRNTRTMIVEQTDKRTGRIGKRPIFFGLPGTADIMATPYVSLMKTANAVHHFREFIPAILWVECKSDVGTQSPEQIQFQNDVEDAGHFYILARSSDDVLRWLKEHR